MIIPHRLNTRPTIAGEAEFCISVWHEIPCAVVAAPSDQWGEVPAAMVVLKPGASVTADELMTYLEERLGKFKLPRIIEFSTEPLPKTGTGKIRKLILKEKFWAGKEKRVQG